MDLDLKDFLKNDVLAAANHAGLVLKLQAIQVLRYQGLDKLNRDSDKDGFDAKIADHVYPHLKNQ